MTETRSLVAQARQPMSMIVLSIGSIGGSFIIVLMGVEWLGLDSRIVYPFATVTASAFNFFGCRHFVFRSAHLPLMPQALRFAASIAAFRLIEIAAFAVLASIGIDYRAAFFYVAGIGFVAKYFAARSFIFK